MTVPHDPHAWLSSINHLNDCSADSPSTKGAATIAAEAGTVPAEPLRHASSLVQQFQTQSCGVDSYHLRSAMSSCPRITSYPCWAWLEWKRIPLCVRNHHFCHLGWNVDHFRH